LREDPAYEPAHHDGHQDDRDVGGNDLPKIPPPSSSLADADLDSAPDPKCRR
jgi:hypothetical protein